MELPTELAGNSVTEGVGFAKFCIVQAGIRLGLRRLWILDDNIQNLFKIVEIQGGSKTHRYQPCSLASVFLHIERQFDSEQVNLAKYPCNLTLLSAFVK